MPLKGITVHKSLIAALTLISCSLTFGQSAKSNSAYLNATGAYPSSTTKNQVPGSTATLDSSGHKKLDKAQAALQQKKQTGQKPTLLPGQLQPGMPGQPVLPGQAPLLIRSSKQMPGAGVPAAPVAPTDIPWYQLRRDAIAADSWYTVHLLAPTDDKKKRLRRASSMMVSKKPEQRSKIVGMYRDLEAMSTQSQGLSDQSKGDQSDNAPTGNRLMSPREILRRAKGRHLTLVAEHQPTWYEAYVLKKRLTETSMNSRLNEAAMEGNEGGGSAAAPGSLKAMIQKFLHPGAAGQSSLMSSAASGAAQSLSLSSSQKRQLSKLIGKSRVGRSLQNPYQWKSVYSTKSSSSSKSSQQY